MSESPPPSDRRAGYLGSYVAGDHLGTDQPVAALVCRHPEGDHLRVLASVVVRLIEETDRLDRVVERQRKVLAAQVCSGWRFGGGSFNDLGQLHTLAGRLELVCAMRDQAATELYRVLDTYDEATEPPTV
jgi:hypothetical protein